MGELPGVFLEAEALREAGAPPRLLRETETRILRAEAELADLRSSMAATGQRIEATTAELDESGNGLIGDPRHHLRHHREPVPPATARSDGRLQDCASVAVGGCFGAQSTPMSGKLHGAALGAMRHLGRRGTWGDAALGATRHLGQCGRQTTSVRGPE